MFDSLDSPGGKAAVRKTASGHGSGFSKIFRWQPIDPHAPVPVTVQLAGSFTDWRALPMTRDAFTNMWQITLHDIPGNHTHRYMLLVDGTPAPDKMSDGLAAPQGTEEQKYQLMTPRGPRVFLLFARTK
jgi:hypothetical protein